MKEPETAGDTELAEKIKDKTSTGSIIGGLIAFGIILFACPPLLLLLPFAIVGLVVLFLMGRGNEQKAARIAKSHLPSGESKLQVDQSTGNADAVTLNDWGIVYVRQGRKSIQVPWHDVLSVTEPHLGVLEFECRQDRFTIDFTVYRYFRMIEAIESQIPGRTDFTVDSVTGKSNLTKMLSSQGFEWKTRRGHFVIDYDGVSLNDRRLSWDDIDHVRESCESVDEEDPIRGLHFSGRSGRFSLDTDVVNTSDLTPRYTDFDLVRAIVSERIPNKVSLDEPAPTAQMRALWEFEQLHEAYGAAFSLALKNGKYAHIEERFRPMLELADKYSLGHHTVVKEFFSHYALLLQRMGRDRDAAALKQRQD